jgi:hypothetical protein
MKLNIEELAREAGKFATSEYQRKWDSGEGASWQAIRDEAFARLIVERCAAICEEEAAGHRTAFGEHCAIMIRRNLLEAE